MIHIISIIESQCNILVEQLSVFLRTKHKRNKTNQQKKKFMSRRVRKPLCSDFQLIQSKQT